MTPAGVLVHLALAVLTVEVSALHAVQIIDGSQCAIFFCNETRQFGSVVFISNYPIEWYSFQTFFALEAFVSRK